MLAPRPNATSVLSIDRRTAISEADGTWQRAGVLDGLPEIEWFHGAASASHELLCGIGYLPDNVEGGREDTRLIGLVYGRGGSWVAVDLEPALLEHLFTPAFGYASCAFDRAETRVALLGQIFAIRDGELAEEVARLDDVVVAGSYDDRFIGTRGDGVVSVDRSGADLQVLVSGAEARGLCQGLDPTELTGPAQTWLTAGRAGETNTALVRRDCGCADCAEPYFLSGTLALHLPSGRTAVVERARAPHTAYETVLLREGGALVMSAQGSASELAPGQLYVVDGTGEVRIVSLPGVQGVVRSAAVPHAQRADRRGSNPRGYGYGQVVTGAVGVLYDRAGGL